MDATTIISLAIPVFMLLLVVEALLSWRRGWGFYRLNDSMINMSLGSGRQLVDLFVKGLLFAAYIGIYELWHWFDIEITQWWQWLLVLLAVDFVYYWQHRISHESNLFWAGHVVHHSSEEFNISVALRQSYVHDLMVYPMFFVLALIGIPPVAFFVGVAVLAIYQYWLHTRTVPRFPEWLEGLINTPSAHRVHHGSNKIYIDKNYAGIFMFIDRVFGTYAKETEEVHYGITKPVNSWNPLWVNAYYFVELAGISRRTAKLRDKLAIWFKGPGWLPDDIEAPAAVPSPRTGHRFDTRMSKPQLRYAISQFLMAGNVSLPLLVIAPMLLPLQIIAALAFAFWGGANVGGLQANEGWVYRSETGRLTVFAVAGPLVILLSGSSMLAVVLAASAAAFCLFSLLWWRRLHSREPLGHSSNGEAGVNA